LTDHHHCPPKAGAENRKDLFAGVNFLMRCARSISLLHPACVFATSPTITCMKGKERNSLEDSANRMIIGMIEREGIVGFCFFLLVS
jgi:hypothetical protein